jgi:hypothetical protein
VASDTARALEAFEAAGVLPRLRTILGRFWTAVGAQDRDGILSEIDAYGAALEGLAGRSPGAERIAELVRVARACGLAAKGSGAVGGDSAVAITFDPARVPAVEKGGVHWRPSRSRCRSTPAGFTVRTVMRDASIERRKRSAPRPLLSADVEHREKTTLLEEVEFVHGRSPASMMIAEVDLSVEFLGRGFAPP